MPVLLALLLLPFYSNAASLPDGEPDHEFTVDHVTYKCYFDSKFNSSYPTEDWKGKIYYTVYAVPENTDITSASIRLQWYNDLKKHISTEEPGYTPAQTYSQTTQLVSGTWSKCTSLKWLELIVNQTSSIDSSNTTDLAPINGLSLKKIFVTGGRDESYTSSIFHIFKNVGKGNTPDKYFSNLTLYKEKQYNQLVCTSLSGFARSLLKSTNYIEVDTEKCNESGFSPKLEVRPYYASSDSPFHTVTYDETGKITAPLIGKFEYRTSLNELIGKQHDISYTSYSLGEEIFDECFDVKRGLAYEILKRNNSTIYDKYGYKSVWVTTSSSKDPQPVDTESDGISYFLPKGSYDIYFDYGDMTMCLYHYINAMDAVSIQDTWMPHCATFTATVDPMVDEFNDDAVYGMAELDNNGNISRFLPFNEQNKVTLVNTDNEFKASNTVDTKQSQQTMWLGNLMTCSFCTLVNGQYVLSGDKYHAPSTIANWGCETLKSADEVTIYFRGLKKLVTKCGIIYDGDKYTPNSDSAIRLYNLLPDSRNSIQVFYEHAGVTYVSQDAYIATTPIKMSCSITPNTQSAIVKFNGYRGSSGTIEYEDMRVSKTGSYGVSAEIEATGKDSFLISGLEPGTSYNLYTNCYYRRESDGQRKKISDTFQATFYTNKPEWDNGEAQALTTTKARLLYSTNLENVADTYVEWRRVDAPAVVQSSKATCPVVDGRLVGILNNLNPDVYYQFRPVYEHQSSKVYGSWVGIFTGDANVWFDPEVVTQPARIRENGSVTLRGSVLPGSGDISEQGFEIWPSAEPSSAGIRANRQAETTHRFVTCDGISMSVDISDLAAGTSYIYRTYAKVNGSIHTGQEERFDIPGTGSVDGITVDEETPEVTGYFNLQGVRSERPFPGLNIVVYSDGKTEKRVFKE